MSRVISGDQADPPRPPLPVLMAAGPEGAAKEEPGTPRARPADCDHCSRQEGAGSVRFVSIP